MNIFFVSNCEPGCCAVRVWRCVWGVGWEWWKCWLGHQSTQMGKYRDHGGMQILGAGGHGEKTFCRYNDTNISILHSSFQLHQRFNLFRRNSLLMLRCEDWLRESWIVFGRAQAAQPTLGPMIGSTSLDRNISGTRSRVEECSHLPSELITARPVLIGRVLTLNRIISITRDMASLRY